ncbi:MAG: serine/threonine-protein kinase PknK [Planctomycetota bacterium]
MKLEGTTVGSYAIGRELGRGGMGTVHLATSLADGPAGKSGVTVAVKFFHPHLLHDSRTFERFRREAEIGMRVRHPHVVRTHQIASAPLDGTELHFMVMEFVEGQTLRDLLRELGTFPEHLLFQVADQVLDALAAIHDSHVVHRDLKPENVVITREHRVLLMDMGVARLLEQGRELTQAGEFLGSLPYAAPEQFLDIEAIGPRTDLYSLGVVLYELATGKNPYAATDIPTILRDKLQGHVRRPRQVNADLDPFWDEVILTCLQRDIAARFSSSAELRRILQEGEEGAWWRERSQAHALPAAERALRRLRVPREAPLVGRTEALDQLHAAYAQASSGSGKVCLVAGSTGTGKSRLVYGFLEGIAHDDGPIVAAGRCVGSGGRSFQPFLEVAHDLLAIDELDPAQRRDLLEARVRAMLPDTPGIAPAFSDLLLGGLAPGVQESLPQDALLAAYAGLVRAASGERPVVLVVEDLHLAGPETVDLFAYLARVLPDHRILLVGVYRDDEVEEGAPLHAFLATGAPRAQAASVAVPALSRPATEDLLRAVVRHERTVHALDPLLYDKCEGNPLILFEMLAHLRREGLLREDGEGLAVKGRLADFSLPSTVKDLLALKLAQLDDESREMLEAAAVLGFEFRASLLAAVLEEKRITLLKQLAVLERKYRLVRSSGKDSFRFAHRQLYEAVYDAMSPALRAEYHSVVADAIEAEHAGADALPAAAAYALVRHLLLADRGGEAEPHVSAALAHAASSFHASYVAPFLEQVAGAMAGAKPGLLFEVRMKQWSCCDALGRRGEQLGLLEQARELAEADGDPSLLARVHCLLGVTRWRTGDYGQAQTDGERALELACRSGNREWEANSLHALGTVALRKGEHERSAELLRRALAIRRETGDRHGEARTLLNLAWVMPEVGQADTALETKQAALAIFRELGDRRGVGATLNNLGGNFLSLNRYEEAIRHFEEAVAIGRELGDLAALGHPLCNLGQAYAVLGRIEEAKSAFSKALALFAEAGIRSGEADVRMSLGRCLLSVGDDAGAAEHLQAGLELARATGAGAQQCEAQALLGTAFFRLGQRERARERFTSALDAATRVDSQSARFCAFSEAGSAALEEGDAERSVELLNRALEQVKDPRRGDEKAILALCRLARAHLAAGRPDEARRLAARAEELGAGERELSPHEGPEICYTLRVVFGDEARGRRYLDQARDLVATRTFAMRDATSREAYLQRTWPTREIVEESRRVLGR